MGYSGVGGKLIHKKNQKQKISWHCPFKYRGSGAEMCTFGVQIIIFHWSEGGERSGPTGVFSGRRWGFIPHSGRSEGFKPYRRSKGRNPPFFNVVAFGSNIPEYGQQRVFNDLQRSQAFWRSYDLAPSPPPPTSPPVNKLNRRHIGRPRKRDNLLMGEGPNLRPLKSLVLYKSFNTLWRPEWLAT